MRTGAIVAQLSTCDHVVDVDEDWRDYLWSPRDGHDRDCGSAELKDQ